MIKRTVAIILSTVIVLGMIGCSDNKEDANNDVAPIKVETRDALPGEWAKDLTRDEVSELHKEILARVEETATFYGLEYEVIEEVKEDAFIKFPCTLNKILNDVMYVSPDNKIT